jgi:hypothetical protein
VTIAIYIEGTGHGGFHMRNDHDQEVVVQGGGASIGELDSSNVELTAFPLQGSDFVGFGLDCAGGANPMHFQLEEPMTCSIRFDDNEI